MLNNCISPSKTKTSMKRWLFFLSILCTSTSVIAAPESMLRIGITSADIPRTLGQPDQGYEGNRFTGMTMYDSLTQWDLSKQDAASLLIPGLAESWAVDDSDTTKWIFKLRSGVKFHDGSDFNADAVVWNVQKVLDKNSIQYDVSQVGNTISRIPTLKSAKKIDNLTVELTTTQPDSFLPINLTNLYIASPVKWQAKYDAVSDKITDPSAKAKQAWIDFAADASGTGPFMMGQLVPRERLEMVKNPRYWNNKRQPTIDKVMLTPLPEANARTAALLSGQVDWIESPAPDAIEQIKSRGFNIYANSQPHLWMWQLSFLDGSPWLDKRVRQAANLCVNRSEMKEILGGLMGEAEGIVTPDHPWWGNPSFNITYDPDTAKKLMQEAGYSAKNPVQLKVQTTSSSSGMMQPLPMNEYLQESLKECFFDVQLDVLEMNTLFTNWRLGAKDPTAKGANTFNFAAATMDPFLAMVRFVSTDAFPPVSNNWGYFNSKEFDQLINTARTTFEPVARDAALAKLHARIVEEAPFIFVAHDVGTRAMSDKVKNVVQPKSWFIDIATMKIE